MTVLDAPARSLVAARLAAVSKDFGGRAALRGLDLEVLSGEVLGLLGPNGAGKTTALRVLTGALRVTSGQVEVLGLDPWTSAREVHRRTGYLPGDLRLPGRWTGADVLDLCQDLRGGVAPRRAELVERLAVRLDVPVRHLSKGNRQKVGLVQALMGAPDLVLLDEPTSGLDPLAQEVVEALVVEAARSGAAVVLSSHVLSEVERVADRVTLLGRGGPATTRRLDALQEAAPHRVRARLRRPLTDVQVRRFGPALSVVLRGPEVRLTVLRTGLDRVLKVLCECGIVDVEVQPADLEELFRDCYEGGRS